MLSFFENMFSGPEKRKKCIRKINKDDGESLIPVLCGLDIWPEPEFEIVDGKKVPVYYCSVHREHKYTEKEYEKIPSE